MASLPYMQFFVADYLRDTQILTLTAQGGWMRILCSMWHPSRKGVLSLRLDALARLLSVPEDAARSILDEISQCEVANVEWGSHGEAIDTPSRPHVTITSRRIVRDWDELHAKKQSMSEGGKKGAEKRWGTRGDNSPPTPPPNGPANSPLNGISEVRIQKSEGGKKKTPPPPNSDEVRKRLRQVWQSAPENIVGREDADFREALPLLLELTEDDWNACRGWVTASNKVRGRKLWPRDRAEFLANIGQAIEAIRTWWKASGRDWWLVKTASGIVPKTSTKPPLQAFIPLSPEEQEEARRILTQKTA